MRATTRTAGSHNNKDNNKSNLHGRLCVLEVKRRPNVDQLFRRADRAVHSIRPVMRPDRVALLWMKERRHDSAALVGRGRAPLNRQGVSRKLRMGSAPRGGQRGCATWRSEGVRHVAVRGSAPRGGQRGRA